jgi:cell division protein FtsQ
LTLATLPTRHGVAQRENKTRPLVWEDEVPAEPRFRRAQAGAPVAGRNLPGMPVEMDDEDEGPAVRSKPRRFGEVQVRPWWRPATTLGRVSVSAGAMVLLAAFSISAFALRNFLEHDARFRIAGTSNIQATGLAQVSRAEMLPVFGEDIGRNVFFVPLTERRKQLEQIPWIEHATVMRLLPNQIRITVTERKPIEFVREGAQVALIDSNGVILTEAPAMMSQHHYSFPVITGIEGRDAMATRRGKMEVYQRLVGELDAGGQHLSDQLSEIDLSDPEDARVLMPEQGTDILAHFGEDHFLERYQRYKAHIAEWRQQYPKLAEVDLRYEQQVVLQMQGAGSATPAAMKPLVETDGSESTAKPDPAKPEVKAPEAMAVSAKQVENLKPATAHIPANPAAKAKNAKAKNTPIKTTQLKNTPKKHPAVKKTAKRTAKKPTPKPHPTTTTGQ